MVRRVKLGGELGSDSIIESGLSGGEQVIVEGTERVRPGAEITASPAVPIAGRS
jgi:membrane fusion protein (multidrug efflux system)